MRRLGSIQCIEKVSDYDAPWIILFHGYGADASDLSPLGDIISTPIATNWLFPQGILEVPIGPGWSGRAWWNIRMSDLQAAADRGENFDFSDIKPDGFETAKKKAFEMIQGLKVPWNQIVLGGFSQGAMLATELYLSAPETPKGLMILSGTLINQSEWKPKVANRQGQSFFMSHGTQDAVLGIKHAQKLETLLCQGGMKGKLMSFGGGHEIPPHILKAAGTYLHDTFKQP